MNSEKLSKKLSYILRHAPESIGGTLDSAGWINTSFLLKSLGITRNQLEICVDTNNKKRFEFNEDGSKIRARQGHSVDVELGYDEKEPPEYLYHGTSTSNLDAIFASGIKKMQRHHVHLSSDESTAKNVGGRHGKPIILRISAKKMWADGCKFYLSNNGVWLTDYIDTKYFQVIS